MISIIDIKIKINFNIFIISALDEKNTRLELLKLGAFGYSWMEGTEMRYTLLPELAELVRRAKVSGKFAFEFQHFLD